eukprot:1952706-Rhodomonas_salina.4
MTGGKNKTSESRENERLCGAYVPQCMHRKRACVHRCITPVKKNPRSRPRSRYQQTCARTADCSTAQTTTDHSRQRQGQGPGSWSCGGGAAPKMKVQACVS